MAPLRRSCSLIGLVSIQSRLRSHIITNKMTKCIGSVTSWTPNVLEFENPAFIIDDVKQGENLLNLRLSNTTNLVQDIISDFCIIKRSACKSEKTNCSHLQDSLTTKLENLYSEISSVIQSICSSNLATIAKHRYFMVFTSGALDKLEKLLRAVGRLSDLDHGLYLEDQRKPMISEESITIHALTAIWSATTTIISSFYEPACRLFKEQSDPQEYSFIDQMDFSTAGPHYAKIFLTDLMITSWLQFNRLVRYQDLVQAIPFLCPCHGRLYISLLKSATKNGEDQELLPSILNSMVDQEIRSSILAQSLRQLEIVPFNQYYKDTDNSNLCYFVVWHLYSLARLASEANKNLLSSCQVLFRDSFCVALDQYIPTSQHSSAIRLSPHQEERMKLLFLMLNRWTENQTDKIQLITHLFSFFDKYWNLFSDNYFHKSSFRVDGLTVFQLCTKLLNEAIPLYAKDGQAISSVEKPASKEEKDLTEIWDRLLSKVSPIQT